MKHLLIPVFCFITLVLATCPQLAAQLNYSPANTQNTAGTYNDISLSGTLIPVSNPDDANSDPINIGFPFVFNGATYTQFILNTNGFIKLGNLPPSSANLFPPVLSPPPPTTVVNALNSSDPRDSSIICGLNYDLQPAVSGKAEFSVLRSGLSGSRVCTIQFKNLTDRAPSFTSLEFQIRLFEGTNIIEVVYGNWIRLPVSNFRDRFCGVGLKGRDSSSTQVVVASRFASFDWVTTTFTRSSLSAVPIFGPLNILPQRPIPDVGRTFRFVPNSIVAGDAALRNIYSLTLAPGFFAAPIPIEALVQNVGAIPLTNLPVTLSITGVNSYSEVQTISTLAPGAQTFVSFTGFSPTTLGNNTLSVSLAPDNNNLRSTPFVRQKSSFFKV
jgi:trimeric autotransporter adhesin